MVAFTLFFRYRSKVVQKKSRTPEQTTGAGNTCGYFLHIYLDAQKSCTYNHLMNTYFDCDSSLGYLTLATNRLMSGSFRKQLVQAGIDLTAEQWGVLAHLWNKGGMSQDALAYDLCVDKSSLSRVLDIMERKGLVKRERDPGDARRKLLFATPKADGMREQCKAVAMHNREWMLAGIPQNDLDICFSVLRRVQKIIRENEE